MAPRQHRWGLSLALVIAFGGCSVVFDYGPDGGSGGGDDTGVGGEGPSGPGGADGSGGGERECDDDDACRDTSSCTDDRCVEGTCRNDARPDGDACENGGGEAGQCDEGVCRVACTEDDVGVCDDENPCTLDACDLDVGQCRNEPVEDGPRDVGQTAGDCRVVVCQGGVEGELTDDSDTPSDGNACTDDVCDNGVPSNPNQPAGTPCGGTLVCDSAGVCVGCNEPADCPGSDTFCRTITCSGGQCGVSDTASGTPLPGPQQTAGPCRERQCDGVGSIAIVNRALGTACDDGLHCNGSDSCFNGNCSQHAGDPCAGRPGDGDSDCSEACNENSDTCSANDPAGSACDDAVFCNGTDTCNSSGSCSNHAGNPCGGVNDGDGDCSEACDEAAEDCNGNDPNGTSCQDGAYCNGTDTCFNGNCSQHSGDPCAGLIGDGDGDCTEACNEGTDSCTAPDPSGAACNDNLYCNGTDTCNGSGSCSTHSGDPCGTTLNCDDWCSEMTNSCTADAPTGSFCLDFGQPGECFNGFCFGF
ncbi:MAG: hypothetical protein AAGA56_03645 [Myxococcota bacterium]